ncbi:hypothetical protein HDU87_004994 [Geranomyces variabilis]|uniref:GRIP domain-containing protein n=1 Tax=Geranomyces variabilis TaxID=109894 RepID=A0AAD5XVB4_9FUNG|nr:hypothetical protein HDU87_004994 [Geranomyces variabilis]
MSASPSSWFDANKLSGSLGSLGSLASKVQHIAGSAAAGLADVGSANTGPPHNGSPMNAHGNHRHTSLPTDPMAWDISDDETGAGRPPQEEYSRVADLEHKYERLQSEMSSQLAHRDARIHELEARLQQQPRTQPPTQPGSPVPGSSDAEVIASLKKKLATAVHHLKQLSAENTNLMQRVTAAQAAAQEPAADSLDSPARVSALEQELARATSRLVELESELSQSREREAEGMQAQQTHMELEKRCNELSAKLQQAVAEKDGLHEQAAQVKRQVETLSEDNKRLVEQQRDANHGSAELEALSQKVDQLTAANRSFETEATEYKRELAALGEENKRLAESLQDAKHGLAELDSLSSTAQQLTADKESFEARVDEYKRELGALGDENRRLAESMKEAKDGLAELDALSSTAQQLTADKESFEAQADEYKRELAALGDENKRLAESLKQAKGNLAELDALSRTAQQLTTAKDEFEHQRQKDARQVDDFRAAMESAVRPTTTITDEGRSEIEGLRAELIVVRHTLDQTRLEKEHLEQALREQQAPPASVAPESVTSSSQDPSAVSSDGWDVADDDFGWGSPSVPAGAPPLPIPDPHADLVARVARKEQEIEDLKAKLDDIQAEHDALQEEGEAVKAERDAAARQMHVFAENDAGLRSEVAALKAANDDLQRRLSGSPLDQAGRSPVTLRRGSASPRDANVTGELQARIATLEKQRSDAEARAKNQADRDRGRIAELQEELQTLRASLVAHANLPDTKLLEAEIEALKHQRDQAEVGRHEEAQRHRDQLDELQSEVERLRASSAAEPSTSVGLADLQERITALERRNAEVEQRLEEEAALHDSQTQELVAGYKRQLREHEARGAALEAAAAAAAERDLRELQSAEVRVQDTLRRVAELEAEVEKYRTVAEKQGLEHIQKGTESHDQSLAEAAILALLDALVAGEGSDNASPTAGWDNMDDVQQHGAAAPPAVHDRVAALSDLLTSLRSRVAQGDAALELAHRQTADLKADLERAAGPSENTDSAEQRAELADLREKCAQAEADVKRLTGERTMLMDRLTTMKNAFAPKLQAEMVRYYDYYYSETAARLRAELAHLQQSTSHVTQSHDTLMADNHRLTSAQALQDETIARLNTDLARLRAHLVETEDAQLAHAAETEERLAEIRRQLTERDRSLAQMEEQAARDRDAARQAQDRVDALMDEADELKLEAQKLTLEKEREQHAVENLMRVLAEFQDSKQAELDQALRTAAAETDDLRAQLEDHKRRLAEAASQAGPAAPAAELAAKTQLVGKLRHDVHTLQQHLAEALRRLHDMTASGDLVDRQVAANLLVGFLELPRGDRRRYDVLNVLASYLRLEDQDRVKIGLQRGPGSGGATPGGKNSAPSTGVGESFTDMWISFLLKESSKGAADNTPPPPPPTDSRRTSVAPLSTAPPPDPRRPSAVGSAARPPPPAATLSSSGLFPSHGPPAAQPSLPAGPAGGHTVSDALPPPVPSLPGTKMEGKNA